MEEPYQDKLFFSLAALVIIIFTCLVVDRLLRG
jgi:hypothetical protein